MDKTLTHVVIGSGPSSLAYTLFTLTKSNSQVILITKDKSLGEKLLIAGSGRCNLFNEHILEDSSSPSYVLETQFGSVFIPTPFTTSQDKKNFEELLNLLNLSIYIDEEGRYYPFSQSGKSVQNAFINALNPYLDKRLKIYYEEEATSIDRHQKVVATKSGLKFNYDKLFVGCGGNASKDLLDSLDIKYLPYIPALGAITPSFSWPKRLIGSKLRGTLKIKDKNGNEIFTESGELLFKEKELSGIVMFDLSLLSLMDIEEITFDTCAYQNQKANRKKPSSYLPPKVLEAYDELPFDDGILKIVLKRKGTSSPNPEIYHGGIDLAELTQNFRYIRDPNISFGGEIIAISGITGGYNIGFALLSGIKASSL